MNYDITYEEWGTYQMYNHAELNPEDFLDCEDEDQLKWDVEDRLWDSSAISFENVDERYYNRDWDKFVEKWKELKNEK